MKILIAGSRYPGRDMLDILYAAMDSIVNTGDMIISGGAKGADSVAALYAYDHNYHFDEHLAEWDKRGKGAGYIRNKTMVDLCDTAIVLWDGTSKGTKHTMDLLDKDNKPYLLIRSVNK